jgi:parallel beta helix pectate lyase-like protein
MTWFREHFRELVSLGAGLAAGAIVALSLPASAAPVQVSTTDGTFPLSCTLVGSHLSCSGDLPTADPTTPPTTQPPTTPPTTVPPTTVPPTTTPPGIGSFATGPAGGSGVPAGTTLTPLVGRLQANTTYTGVSVPASALGTVTVSGLTLRNCTLASGVVFTGNNVTVDHCTIRGGVSLSGGDNFTFTGNNVTGWDDGLHITSDSGPVNTVRVTGNWIHQPTPACSDHSDGVQVLGVAGAVFTGNVIDLGPWIPCGPLNGAFQFENTQGPVSRVTVSNNLLNGGGITFRSYSGTQLDAVTGNGFGPDDHFNRQSDTLTSRITTWSGNFVVASGAPVIRQ